MDHEWNVMATAISGHQADLIGRLREFGDFRPSRYRDVVVGWVEDPEELLERVSVRMAGDARLASALGRLVINDVTVPFEARDPAGALRDAVERGARRIADREFHVRVDARGGGRTVHVHQLELALADIAWAEIERCGYLPRVGFADPDVVLMVEIVGDRAGISLVDREQRQRFPFMKVD